MAKQKAFLLLGLLVIGLLCSAFESTDGTSPNKYEYAILIGSTKLGIGDQVSTRQLFKLLAKPISEKTQIAKDDTYSAGITFRTIQYDGLTLELCMGSDENYFITTIVVTNANFPTSLGIKVGDTLERLKEIYPVEQLPPSADASPVIYEYAEGDAGVYVMQFELSDGKITKITFSQTWD